jgi:putative endonuclease
MSKRFYVYILASDQYGTLYTGVTSDLIQRIWQHKNKAVEGFTETYSVDQLVYDEIHESADAALQREKQIKKWNRNWKIELIQKMNPEWKDLYETIL